MTLLSFQQSSYVAFEVILVYDSGVRYRYFSIAIDEQRQGHRSPIVLPR